jgi:hypothetical protein
MLGCPSTEVNAGRGTVAERDTALTNASVSGVGGGVSWIWKSVLGPLHDQYRRIAFRIKRFALCCALARKDAYHQELLRRPTPFAPTQQYHH